MSQVLVTCKSCGGLQKKDHNYLIQEFFTRFSNSMKYHGKKSIPISRLKYIKREREIPKKYIKPFKNAEFYPPELKPLYVLDYNSHYYVVDGNHRVTGAVKAGYKGNMTAKVYSVDDNPNVATYVNGFF